MVGLVQYRSFWCTSGGCCVGRPAWVGFVGFRFLVGWFSRLWLVLLRYWHWCFCGFSG